jgi:hypothetical protein
MLTLQDIEYQPGNTVQTGETNSSIAQFQEFTRRELPRLVRQTLEAMVEKEAQPIEDKIKESLVDIVSICQNQIDNMYYARSEQSLSAAGNPRNVSSDEEAMIKQDVSELESKGTETHFEDFDGIVVSETAYIAMPALQLTAHDYERQSEEAKIDPAVSETSSPDSGYNSSKISLSRFSTEEPQSQAQPQEEVTTYHPHEEMSAYPPQQVDFIPGVNYVQQAYATTAPYIDVPRGFPILDGYFGLFQDTQEMYDVTSVDPSWTYPSTNGARGTMS